MGELGQALADQRCISGLAKRTVDIETFLQQLFSTFEITISRFDITLYAERPCDS
jgi:hypothetical protein